MLLSETCFIRVLIVGLRAPVNFPFGSPLLSLACGGREHLRVWSLQATVEHKDQDTGSCYLPAPPKRLTFNNSSSICFKALILMGLWQA